MKHLASLTFIIVILLAACSTDGPSDASPSELVMEISDLEGIEQLRKMFNEDAGTPRLLLLMSPT